MDEFDRMLSEMREQAMLASGDLVTFLLDEAVAKLADVAYMLAKENAEGGSCDIRTYAERQRVAEEAIGHAHSINIESLASLGALLPAQVKRAKKPRPSIATQRRFP